MTKEEFQKGREFFSSFVESPLDIHHWLSEYVGKKEILLKKNFKKAGSLFSHLLTYLLILTIG
jgi:hypothetical protein